MVSDINRTARKHISNTMERREVDEPLCVAINVALLYEDNNFILLNEKDFDEAVKGVQEIKCDEPRKRAYSANEAFTEHLGVLFYKITGKDELLDAYELQRVMDMVFAKDLKLSEHNEFSLETCRCLIASIDRNRRGTLNYHQFKKLWFEIMKWKKLFEVCDENNDKKIDYNELKKAVSRLGFSVKEETIRILKSRYTNREGVLDLDDFCGICSKLTTLRNNFEEMELSEKCMTYDRFLMECLYS
eukprot:TCONS_00019543-protein